MTENVSHQELQRLRTEVRAARAWDDEMRIIGSGISLGDAMDRYREVRAQNSKEPPTGEPDG